MFTFKPIEEFSDIAQVKIISYLLIVVVVDAVTCIICGICVFSTMGNLALEQGKSVNDVIADGPGLVFVVFPHALAKMPIPQLWSATFFFMLILLGIDSQVNILDFYFYYL